MFVSEKPGKNNHSGTRRRSAESLGTRPRNLIDLTLLEAFGRFQRSCTGSRRTRTDAASRQDQRRFIVQVDSRMARP